MYIIAFRGAAQQIILNSCGFGDSVCQADMVKMFTEEVLAKCDATRILSECSQYVPNLDFQNTIQKLRIPAPFRAESYCEAVRNGNSDTFEKVFHWYKTERNQVEKLNLMTALTCSKDILTLKK